MTVFCRRCVVSSNRPISSREYSRGPGSEPPRMAFIDGVCGACRHHDAKNKTDWQAKEEELRELLARYRRNDGHPDVLLGGSGGKDSIFTAHLLKDKYGMSPLTITWRPNAYTDVGWRNFNRWLELGFSNFLVTPSPVVHRKLTRLAFLELLNPFQPFILGQRSLAPKIAKRWGIKLVMFGESDADYEGEPGWQDKRETEVTHISGVPIEDLIGKHGLTRADLHLYMPESADDVEALPLGRFIRWDPEEAYYYAVEVAGFEANEERTPGTFTKFSSIDDRLDPLHYHTMWNKFGVGRATHDASMEIRHGRMTREEGVALVRKYDGTELTDEYVTWCCGYMNLNPDEFWETLYRFKKNYPVVQ